MKSNRGVTLTSLIIYIIGLVIVIALMANLSGYFFKNLSNVTMKQSVEEQYSSFLSYITKDANSNNLINVQSSLEGKDCIIFQFDDETEHQYIVQDENLYFISIEGANEKKIVLCENVSTSGNNVFTYADSKIDINFNICKINFSARLNVKI